MSRFTCLMKKTLAPLTVAGLTATLIACGGGGSSDDDSASRDYAGAGSRWDVSLDDSDNTFTITRRINASSGIIMTVNGSFQTLGNGFISMVVSDASGTDAPDPGDTAIGLEVEGYAFFLKPLDGDQVIPMISAGNCPTDDINANWVIVKKGSNPDASDPNRDFYGSFAYDTSTDTPSLPAQYSLTHAAYTGGSGIPGNGSCSDGVLEVTDAEMYLTANGGAIVHTNIGTPSDSSIIFALPKKAISNISNASGSYAGLLFDGNDSSGDQVQPVSVVCDASGSCSGTIINDVAANTLSVETVAINLSGTVDSPTQGFVTGDIEGSGNIACMLDGNVLGTGKKVMSCVGQSPGDPTDMFNILLVSQ